MNVKEIIKIGLILFAITAVSAALLAFVNGKTAPLIEKNSLEKEQTALRAVMPDAAEFEQTNIGGGTELGVETGVTDLNKVFAARDNDGNVIGACVITESTGYDTGIQTVTGVDTDLKVTGVEIIAMNETPGLGAKAAEESFRGQYMGKSGEIGVSKNGSSDTEIQAISGATKTSKGVTNGVNLALKAAEIAIGIAGGDK